MNFAFSTGPPPSITIVSSLYAQAGAVAPAALATIIPTAFAIGTAGVDVAVVDASGQEYDIPPFSVTSSQIVVALPAALATGEAVFTVTPTGGNPVSGSVNVTLVAPSIMSADGSGGGAASATVTTTHPDGSITVAPGFVCLAPASCTPLTIALGDPTQQQVVVTLYGTGIRGMSSLAGVTVALNQIPAVVLAGGPQGDYPWLDQVSFQLPAGVAAAGVVSVVLTIDGTVANTVTLNVN
jgi:uncharacterized protein (TIGR03437 family)